MYLTNDAGDIWGRRLDDGAVEVDPGDWGWAGGKTVYPPEHRRTLESVQALPDFTVEVFPGPTIIPGPKARTTNRSDGCAPPAVLDSKDGKGTRENLDRLSDALGKATEALIKDPERSPFVVHDHVGGRVIRISFVPPPPGLGGSGKVYFVTDGVGIKIGYTTVTVARRVDGLKTGNPNPITALVTVHGVTEQVEERLHAAFDEHRMEGEWFHWQPLVTAALAVGGWEHLVLQHLGDGDWRVEVHQP